MSAMKFRAPRRYAYAHAAIVFMLISGTTLVRAQGVTYQYKYDAQGNITQVIDPLGRVTDQTYDALNRLQQKLLPAAAGTSRPAIAFSYDGLGQLMSITDPRNLVTSYVVTGLGDQTGLTSPDTGVRSSTYDAAGNVLTTVDAKGQTTHYTYDVLNRVTRIEYADDAVTTYNYDQGANGIGRLTGIIDASGATLYAYDQKGRVQTETRTVSGSTYVVGYSYDNAGRLSSITYPSGTIVSYTRDSTGRIKQIDVTRGNATQTIVSQVTYRPFGGVQSFVNGANATVNRSYDLEGRVTSYTLGGQTQLINYDLASRINFIADTVAQGVTRNYSYDGLDRIIGLQSDNLNISYEYDKNGNRTSQTIGSGLVALEYTATSNRLNRVVGPQINNVNMDANGSITSNGINTFNYDGRGRMISASTSQGTVQYGINALGQRVKKTDANGTTIYHYDIGGKLISESKAGGGYVKEYIYLDEVPVAFIGK
jgi:YD repeat-containing protein